MKNRFAWKIWKIGKVAAQIWGVAVGRQRALAVRETEVEGFDIESLRWFFSQMSKLYRARSLLYRRQILQENIIWKARDEIYKIYMLLHRSDLNILAKKLSFFFLILQQILQNFVIFE